MIVLIWKFPAEGKIFPYVLATTEPILGQTERKKLYLRFMNLLGNNYNSIIDQAWGQYGWV